MTNVKDKLRTMEDTASSYRWATHYSDMVWLIVLSSGGTQQTGWRQLYTKLEIFFAQSGGKVDGILLGYFFDSLPCSMFPLFR